MEQVFAGTTFVFDVLAEFVELLFYCPLLCWVAGVPKLYTRCVPFLLPLLGFFPAVCTSQDASAESRSGEEISTVELRRRRRTDRDDVGVLSRRDVEMVMEKMGLGCSSEDARFKDVLGAGDLNSLFEEKEPSLGEVKDAFCVFDRNGDGFVDAEELQRVLAILGLREGSTSVDDCRRMVHRYDENGDGRIDFNEFVKLMDGSFC